MRPTTILLFFIFMMFMQTGSKIYEDNPDTDIYNLTNSVQWEEYSNNTREKINDTLISNNVDKIIKKSNRFENIFYRILNTCGYVLFEISKFSVEYGFENSDYNYRNIAFMFLFLSFLPLFVPLIGILVVSCFLLSKFVYKNLKKIEEKQ